MIIGSPVFCPVAAMILTLPNRELAVIGTFDLPKTKQTGAFKIDAFIYLDRKNKPSDKSGLVASGDINIQKESGSLNGEVKFVYPSQSKVRHVNTYFLSSAEYKTVLNLSCTHRRRSHAGTFDREGNLTEKVIFNFAPNIHADEIKVLK